MVDPDLGQVPRVGPGELGAEVVDVEVNIDLRRRRRRAVGEQSRDHVDADTVAEQVGCP